MIRKLTLAALAVAAVGVSAPAASARCDMDANPLAPVTCTVGCAVARLSGAACKA